MDFELIKPELNEKLIAQTEAYLAAVDAGDIDTMEHFYDKSFVNIRYDKEGNAANISKDVFMSLLRGWNKHADGNHPLEPAETTKFVATSEYDTEVCRFCRTLKVLS